MGRKRKASRNVGVSQQPVATKYAQEERFDDSEDDFFASRDKILLDEGPATKRRRRVVEQEKDLQPSDEEVLAHEETDDDDLDKAQSVGSTASVQDEEDEDGHWGASKADYYDADLIETEADALEEENEARRLQMKQIRSMTDADYGFDETQWVQQEQKKLNVGTVVEKLPEIRIPAKASRQEKIEILNSRYPEFAPLSQDLVDLQKTWEVLNRQANEVPSNVSGVTAITKLRAISSYLGAIAMYFAVIASQIEHSPDPSQVTALSPSELREHAVIGTLMETRRTWDAVKEAKEVDVKSSSMRKDVGKFASIKATKDRKIGNKKVKARVEKKQSMSDSEDGLDLDVLAPVPVIETKAGRTKPMDLQSLLAQTTIPSIQTESDFGDEDPLTAEQAADKAKRKKSLRFYTSQITQKANKRGAASREAGGDDDVPRKERLRDKQERLLKDAERRGQQKATSHEELGGDDSEGASANEGNEYYQSLVAASDRKKAAKQARSEAYAEAAKQGAQVFEAEQIGPDGKRRITYAIEKNKGLTPKRKKDVRNPRVKKRKKFDEKMKKLGSIRQVYKGGEGKGGYGGELTGIKTNVVKSVKL